MKSEDSVDSLIQENTDHNCCMTLCAHCSQEGKASDDHHPDNHPHEDSSLCKENDTESQNGVHEFLEGGWGWVIVFASFFNSFIFDGISSSYGVLYPYILEKFQASAFLTSFGGSMFSAYLIMGSAAAALIKRFGFRAVSVTGGLLSCIALVAASYCSNIYLFLLTYGIMGGASVGVVYLSSMVIVNGYFNKKRGITNGIISSGSGMGLLVLAPLINSSLGAYSLNGTILLLAGVMLNICVFSALFRQPRIYNSECYHQTHKFEACIGEDENEDESKETSVDNCAEDVEIEVGNTKMNSDISKAENDNNSNKLPPLVITYVDKLKHGIDRNKHVDNCLGKSENFLFQKRQPNHHSLSLKSVDKLWNQSPNHLSMRNVSDKLTGQQKRFPSQRSTYLVFSDIGANSYLTGSVSRLLHIHQQHFTSSHYLQTPHSQSKCESLHRIPAHVDESLADELCHNEASKETQQLPQDLTHFTSHESMHGSFVEGHVSSKDDLQLSAQATPELLGYSISELMRNLSFHLFCVGACLIQFGYPVPGVFLADLAASHGISSQHGAMMISLIGSFNIGGRLLAGFLANMKINPIRLNDMAMFAAAILCFLCPLYTTMWSLCVFAALYGFLLGFFPPLQPLIIVKYFGIGSLASTFGFVTTLKGFAGLIGTPLAGWIFDISLDYSLSIMFAGVAFLLSVVVNEALVYVANREERSNIYMD